MLCCATSLPNDLCCFSKNRGFTKGVEFLPCCFNGNQNRKIRIVPPFSYQSLQKNTIVYPLLRSNLFRPNRIQNTLFRKYFLRGDMPVRRNIARNKARDLSHPEGRKLIWSTPPEELDYSFYLPIFFDGLGESVEPYKGLVREGIHELIMAEPKRILPVLPQLILPLKKALNTKIPDVMIATLKVIQEMISMGPCVGQALVPYYRQLLPIFNLFLSSLGSCTDSSQYDRLDDAMENTLKLMEICGGPDAYINIKYMIPTYESVVLN